MMEIAPGAVHGLIAGLILGFAMGLWVAEAVIATRYRKGLDK